jgi:protein-L-isoaspartate(D-aspartate) O-methyltransferase
MVVAGFIPLVADDGEHIAGLRPAEVTLIWDDDQSVDPDGLHGVLDGASVSQWSGISVGRGDPLDRIWLRLAVAEAGTCQIVVLPDKGLPIPLYSAHGPAIVHGASLAYVVQRPADDSADSDERRIELGAAGYGPDAAELCGSICSQLKEWSSNRTVHLTLVAYRRSGWCTAPRTGRVVRKGYSFLHMSI